MIPSRVASTGLISDARITQRGKRDRGVPRGTTRFTLFHIPSIDAPSVTRGRALVCRSKETDFDVNPRVNSLYIGIFILFILFQTHAISAE